MRYDDILNGINENADIKAKDLLDIIDAITQVYPMIVLANLTKNSYLMLKDEGFLYEKMVLSGNYDEMITDGVKNIHPDYQSLFMESFSRELLVKSFEHGKNEVEARLYQRNQKGKYHWVSTKVIRLNDESGDMVQICLNQVLSKEHGDRYGHLL